MTNTEILFASLLGSRIVKSLPNLGIIQNELQKHVLPTLPFLPVESNEVSISQSEKNVRYDTWQSPTSIPAGKQFFPLSLSIDGGKNWFLLPYETMIDISGSNSIKRTSVNSLIHPNKESREMIGTIKERYGHNDYEITITGVLVGAKQIGSFVESFPKSDFEKLREVLIHKKAIKVTSPPLELLDIHYIVIEEFNFPFTKGENVQAYVIKAYSDTPEHYNLILP